MVERIRSLCKQYTVLSNEDIEELIIQAEQILSRHLYPDNDVFIDVMNGMTGDAIVVFQRPPLSKASLYSKDIVGQKAERKNEAAVYRTFETSLNTVGLLARSQENVMVRQRVYPIRNRKKNIGVVIVEDSVDEKMKDFLVAQNNTEIEQNAPISITSKEFVTDNIDEGILIFNSNGYLVQMNRAAESYYHGFGYLDDILGMHYDNLSLDMSTFEQLNYLRSRSDGASSMEKEIKFGDLYFEMKYIFDEVEGTVIVIIHDVTEVRRKEAEISDKAVVIKEIHHRVKNNLQSVVSILSIQARRCSTDEAKKVLTESVYRIMAIARTHELLSKQLEDDISLKSVLDSVVENMHRCYENLYHITIDTNIDEQLILSSDVVVTIALVVNELVQNCYDHAFKERDQGNILVMVSEKNGYVYISIEDNGIGYPKDDIKQNNLGLQIVTSYVREKLSGKLTVQSSDRGTKTSFYFKK
ncbi:sensor histidine kinase [Enterococcus termitis]|uniref:histidine kinase n=1 Tax=Enterococcus termitis TaxID=332950 RepID=A0A1E5H704_9ENTE|nr:sensor histidine kinase [Enterococcus termitis]OEG20729.1 ethanolamine utilization protein [Enterococcus termitis]